MNKFIAVCGLAALVLASAVSVRASLGVVQPPPPPLPAGVVQPPPPPLPVGVVQPPPPPLP